MSSRLFAEPGMVRDLAHYGSFEAPFDLECDFVAIDVETTGFEPSQGARVIEFAAHRTRGDGEVMESFTTLINHGETSTGAEFIHGISTEMLIDAPTFAEVWPAIESITSNAVLVAHNATFDMSFLASEISLAGVTMPTVPGLCTYWLSRLAFPNSPNHKLATVAKNLGITNSREHDASADALVVVQALPRMLAQVDPVRHFLQPSPRLAMPAGIKTKGR